MNWRDLLYFSKGERRALTVLVCLITTAWIILLLTEPAPESIRQDSRTNTRVEKSSASAPQPGEKKREPDSARRNQEKNTKSFFREKKGFLSNGNSNPSEAYISQRGTESTASYQKYPRTEKYPNGTIIELNTADTTSLKKVPGIGSGFANRIVKYRTLLGGFYSVSQLREVYGIDEERYKAMETWFSADTSFISRLHVNLLPADSLPRHPYLNYRQTRTLKQIRKQKSRLSGWENLKLMEEFTEADRNRLTPYFSFE